MIINQQALASLYTGFTAVFNAAFQDTPTWHERVAMTVPANTRIMDYKFLLDFPMVREWIGDRQISSLEPKAFQVESKDWEATIEVDRNDIEDDQLGLYNPIISALAQEARKHPEKLIADLLNGGFTTACYDGHNFFATDHPVGAARCPTSPAAPGSPGPAGRQPGRQAVHLPTAAGSAAGADGPPGRRTRLHAQKTALRRGLPGGRGLRPVADGLCQQETLNCHQLRGGPGGHDGGEERRGPAPGTQPNLLLVPPSLEAQAREILQAQFIIGDPASGGAKTNIWQGTADLLVVPELT